MSKESLERKDSQLAAVRGTEKSPVARLYFKQHFKITTFIVESGDKLRLPTVAVCAACVLYHRFYKHCKPEDFDAHLVGTTALYLASKSEEVPRKLRDVINVCYRSCHEESPPLEISSKYWELKDSVVKCELTMLRVLKFHVTVDNPHKYLLHYLKSLEDWTDYETWRRCSVGQLSWSLLRDSFHLPLCLEHPPGHIAVAVVYFALHCLGFQIPSQGAQCQWWQVFCSGCKEEDLHCIVEKLMHLYSFENKILE